MHVVGAQQGDGNRVHRARIGAQQAFIGYLQDILSHNRALEEDIDLFSPRAFRGRDRPIRQPPRRRHNSVHLGGIGNLQFERIGFAMGDLVDHGSLDVQDALFGVDRMKKAGICAHLSAQVFGDGLGPGEDHAVAHRDEGGRYGGVADLGRDDIGARRDPHLFLPRQDQFESGNRDLRNLQSRLWWPLVAEHGDLERHLDLVHAAPLEKRGEV